MILFDAASGERTLIRSFRIGCGDSPEHEGPMQFFLAGHAALFANLKAHLEPAWSLLGAYLEKGEARSGQE